MNLILKVREIARIGTRSRKQPRSTRPTRRYPAARKERMEIEEKRVRIFEQTLRTIERVLDEVTVEIPGYQGLTYNDKMLRPYLQNKPISWSDIPVQ